MANPWFESVAEAQRRAKKRLPKSVYGALIAGSELMSFSVSPPQVAPRQAQKSLSFV